MSDDELRIRESIALWIEATCGVLGLDYHLLHLATQIRNGDDLTYFKNVNIRVFTPETGFENDKIQKVTSGDTKLQYCDCEDRY